MTGSTESTSNTQNEQIVATENNVTDVEQTTTSFPKDTEEAEVAVLNIESITIGILAVMGVILICVIFVACYCCRRGKKRQGTLQPDFGHLSSSEMTVTPTAGAPSIAASPKKEGSPQPELNRYESGEQLYIDSGVNTSTAV